MHSFIAGRLRAGFRRAEKKLEGEFSMWLDFFGISDPASMISSGNDESRFGRDMPAMWN
ncbi:MAG: hypothetical protein VB138_15020 [Burkholderia sp.]